MIDHILHHIASAEKGFQRTKHGIVELIESQAEGIGFDGTFYCEYQFIDLGRFRQKIIRTKLDRLYRCWNVGVAGYDNDGDSLVRFLKSVERFYPVHPRHFEVKKNTVRTFISEQDYTLRTP